VLPLRCDLLPEPLPVSLAWSETPLAPVALRPHRPVRTDPRYAPETGPQKQAPSMGRYVMENGDTTTHRPTDLASTPDTASSVATRSCASTAGRLTQAHSDPPISPRHRTGLSSLHSVLGLHGRLSPTHNAIPTTQRTRGATAPEDPSSEAATKTKETACHGTRSTGERRIVETINPASPKPTNRPRTSGGNHLVPIILSGHPNNQPVRIVRTTNQSQPNKPSSALPVGTTWCLATTIVRTTNQSESSEQPTSRNPTNRVAHFRWEPPGALLPPTSMRSETGKGVGQCIPRQRVGGGIRRRAPH
jgi:hypothetical protein